MNFFGIPFFAQADSRAAAELVLCSFPGDHPDVVASLEGTPWLQYLYLKSAIQVCNAPASVPFMS